MVSTRPQFIKAFSVSQEIQPEHEEMVIDTGQHYDKGLSDVFSKELSVLDPDYYLGVGPDAQ